MLVNDYEKSFDIILCHYPDTEGEHAFLSVFLYRLIFRNWAVRALPICISPSAPPPSFLPLTNIDRPTKCSLSFTKLTNLSSEWKVG